MSPVDPVIATFMDRQATWAGVPPVLTGRVPDDRFPRVADHLGRSGAGLAEVPAWTAARMPVPQRVAASDLLWLR